MSGRINIKRVRMNIIKTTSLNDLQKKDIFQLEEVCKIHDKLQGNIFLSNAINFNREINCFYMLYEEQKMISFMAIFMPTQKEAEISAYTLPEHRQQGCFRSLLHEVINELKKYSINNILFVQEPASADAKLVCDRLDAKYEYSEYLLSYNGEPNFIIKNEQITLKQYSNECIEDIAQIYVDVFQEDPKEAYSMVKKLIESKDIITCIAYLNGKMIGVCNVNTESDEVSIFGFGIATIYQGNGYGKKVLCLLLERLSNMKKSSITLEVSSVNNIAFNLYRKCGFEIKTQYDYYRYQFNDISD